MKAYVEPQEVTSMKKAASCVQDEVLIDVLFHLGCRVTEALALTVDDIDFDQSVVTIRHLKRRLNTFCSECEARLGLTHVFCPKCGGRIGKSQIAEQEHRRQRVLPVEDETLKLLGEYVERGGPVIRDGKKLIFAVGGHQAWRIVRQCGERAGLPKLVNPETGRLHQICAKA